METRERRELRERRRKWIVHHLVQSGVKYHHHHHHHHRHVLRGLYNVSYCKVHRKCQKKRKTMIINNNKLVISGCPRRNERRGKSWDAVWRPRVTVKMWRGAEGRSTCWRRQLGTPVCWCRESNGGRPTSRRWEAEDRSRRLDVMLTTRVKHDCR